ncbi:MAG: hypothetical protein CMJ88_14815 [Planctomycetes bacterium]|nr:hypothetical protein [Planctomycetota bacterium]
MRRRRCAVVAVALSAATAAAQVDLVVSGRCFEVRCSGVEERVAQQALATVEPVWSRVCTWLGVPPTPPRAPLPVYLYRDASDYRQADRRLTAGRFAPNQAMSHWGTKSAHVAVQPPCPDALLAARGLPLQTQAMLAWEACHIARYELCENFRVHPGWFYDGLAATVSMRVLAQLHPELGPQPFFEQRWVRARRLASTGDLPGVQQLVTDRIQGLQMRDRYAARVAFFGFAEQAAPDLLRRVASVVRTTPSGTDYAKTVVDAALEELGGLQRAFHRRAADARPIWDEQIRSLWCRGDEWDQQAFPEADAVALRSEAVRGPALRASGAVQIEACGPREMRLLLGCTARGSFALALRPGGFQLIDAGVDGSVRQVVAEGVCDELRVDVFCPFSLSVRGRDVILAVGRESWTCELPRTLPRDVRWGVSAARGGAGFSFGSAGTWRGVKVEAQ